MAVLVEFDVLNATPEQMYELEERTRQRGEALGRPPYAGCMFLAVAPRDSAFHFVSAWRTEDDFTAVLETMLGPDFAACRSERKQHRRRSGDEHGDSRAECALTRGVTRAA